jgi:hypothetical protein
MALIKCKECGHEISKKAETCPNCGAKRKKSASGGCLLLIILAVLFIGYIGSQVDTSSYDTQSTNYDSPKAAPVPEEPKLLLLDWSWHQESGYAIVEGQVKNISDRSLENVQAVVEFYAEDKSFITSDDSLIEYKPLLPGQTSPFKVYASWNPRMTTANIDFKKLFGGSIYWKKQE